MCARLGGMKEGRRAYTQATFPAGAKDVETRAAFTTPLYPLDISPTPFLFSLYNIPLLCAPVLLNADFKNVRVPLPLTLQAAGLPVYKRPLVYRTKISVSLYFCRLSRPPEHRCIKGPRSSGEPKWIWNFWQWWRLDDEMMAGNAKRKKGLKKDTRRVIFFLLLLGLKVQNGFLVIIRLKTMVKVGFHLAPGTNTGVQFGALHGELVKTITNTIISGHPP